jgi:hypothetical protein
MAKFHGLIGYGHNQETAPGVWEDVITEKTYSGDVLTNSRRLVQAPRRLSPTGEVNDDITVGNAISILADPYASANYFTMRYVVWQGVRWIASEVKVAERRLIISLGGVYNGPTA